MRPSRSAVSLLMPLLVCPLLLAAAAECRAADVYQVDGAHSFVTFRVKHMGIGYAYGRFNDLSGTFLFDSNSAVGLTFDMKIKADSVDTGNAKRDQHLKGPDFFNVKEYPTISFKSKEVRRYGEKGYDVSGDLELHGVVRPVTMRLDLVGSGKDPWGGYRSGFEGSFVIRRSEFGMKFGLDGGLSDEVQITVAFEGIKK